MTPPEGRTRLTSTDELIDHLVRTLEPVKRLPRPFARAGFWVAYVLAAALLIGSIANLPAVKLRLLAAPDMWLAVVGSVLTMVTATFAAFEASLPDRSRRWWFLPGPALALWLGASGVGCFRAALQLASIHRATFGEAMRECLPFIIGMSVPLALILGYMLHRAYPLRSGPVSILGGLAAASAAASLLWLVHPFDASAVDIAVHAAAVLTVVGVARSMARYIAPAPEPAPKLHG